MGVLYREIPAGFLDMKCQTCFFYSEYLARIISYIYVYVRCIPADMHARLMKTQC